MSVGRLLAWAGVASGITYLVEYYSFALAHSPAGLLAVIVCPGILVVVLNFFGEILIGWIIAIAVNVIFYEAIWRFVKSRRKRPTAPT